MKKTLLEIATTITTTSTLKQLVNVTRVTTRFTECKKKSKYEDLLDT